MHTDRKAHQAPPGDGPVIQEKKVHAPQLPQQVSVGPALLLIICSTVKISAQSVWVDVQKLITWLNLWTFSQEQQNIDAMATAVPCFQILI